MNTLSERRLNGWKSIAAYFGRDRSTVVRWARDRGLPVHQIPGGKTRTVYALEHELAAWARQASEDTEVEHPAPNADQQPLESPIVPLPAPPGADAIPFPAGRRLFLVLAVMAGMLIMLAAFALYTWRADPARNRMPADPAVAADYVAARDAWGKRTRKDLTRALALYRSVIARDSQFAPARAGLAETWLIYREYAATNDAKAFEAARTAARAALALDPDLPSAHRAMGFVQYWWDNNPERALPSFKTALRLDPRDGQTQFWYANVLADLGAYDEAERYYAAAKLALPGMQAIAVEHACAQWQAGRVQRALALLADLRDHYPQDPTIRNCLMWAYMADGDIRAYSREFSAYAALREDAALRRLAARLAAAVASRTATAYHVLIDDAENELAIGTRRIRAVPAFYAASMGDRETLIRLLNAARLGGEQWYWPAIIRNIEKRWSRDGEVLRLLDTVKAPPPAV